MLLDVFELNGKYYVYAVGPNGEAMGEPRGGPFDSEEIARAELAKMQGAPATQSAPAQAPQRIPAKSTTATAETVTITRAEFAALQSQVSAQSNQIKAMQAAGTGRITGMEDLTATRPYKSLREQLPAIIDAGLIASGRKSGSIDTRLLKMNEDYAKAIKASGLNESTANEGGYLLEPTITKELLMPLRTPETSPFVSRARKLPVGTNSNSGWINAVNETSRATGSRWGGVTGYRLAEGQTVDDTNKPDFRRINWELKKYILAVQLTDELINDVTQMVSLVTQAGGEELTFMANDDVLNGPGTAGPLGMLNSPALVTIDKESGQPAATVNNKNLIKMWRSLHPRARANAAWFINSEVEPQLDELYIPVGAAGLEPRYVTYGADNVMKIKGKPVVVTEFNAALGTVGDIVLADMSEYLLWDKAPDTQTSMHVYFLSDKSVLRIVYRIDGKPSLASKITPYKATAGNYQSTMVALATRA